MKEEKLSDENIFFFQLQYLSHKNIHWAELEKQKSFSKNKSNLPNNKHDSYSFL